MGTPVNKWFIAYRGIGETDWKPIEPPKGTYQADPFLFERDGITYLFYEDYDYDKGVISYSILGNTITPAKRVLVRPYHLSFPCIFEENNEIWMIPETGRANRIELYRAKQFPDEWEFVKVLVENVCASDVVYKKNHLYTTVDGDHKPRIYSGSLLGEWRLTRAWEAMNSRPAGHILEENGRLVIPTQDGEKSYGRAIIFRDLETWKELRRIEPDWYPNLIGCHTYNKTDKFEVTDGKLKL